MPVVYELSASEWYDITIELDGKFPFSKNRCYIDDLIEDLGFNIKYNQYDFNLTFESDEDLLIFKMAYL